MDARGWRRDEADADEGQGPALQGQEMHPMASAAGALVGVVGSGGMGMGGLGGGLGGVAKPMGLDMQQRQRLPMMVRCSRLFHDSGLAIAASCRISFAATVAAQDGACQARRGATRCGLV